MYDKHGEKYDATSLKEQIVKLAADSTQVCQSLNDIGKIKKSIDSIATLYAHADSVAFYAYYVSANIYLSGAPEDQGKFIISRDWKVRR